MKTSQGSAWRRFKSTCKSRKSSARRKKNQSHEKNWKLLYARSEKLKRAKQLGVDYPKRTTRQILDIEKLVDE